MLSALWLVPAFPLLSAILLALVPRLSKRMIAILGCASIGLSAIVSCLVLVSYLGQTPTPYTELLWNWIQLGDFRPAVALYLDPLAGVMIGVVTFVAFWIHLYSVEYMRHDGGYARFFAYMNLFVASMAILVLADNLLLLYLGWEGVGLCSYLLIGFWYHDPVNTAAARKAFIVTRVGDTALILGILLLFAHFGTLNIQRLMEEASLQWRSGGFLPEMAAALLLGGAIGKSAQIPLQVWLPDAMAGPTPTSALIHAATMVTAGVYLIARTQTLFALAPQVQFAVAVIGALTLLAAGCSALTQSDLKRVLAYSTISQIGYMFLALGVGAGTAAIFHLFTHAFFKALLFLGAGAVIESLADEHDIFRMGGLRRELPIVFWTFLIGGCSLAGLPFITGGSYSKDLIVWSTLASPRGNPLFWWAGAIGVLLTALYTFRLIVLVFFGERHTPVTYHPGTAMNIALIVLACFSVTAGWVGDTLRGFLSPVFVSPPPFIASIVSESLSNGIMAIVFAAGVFLAYVFIRRRSNVLRQRIQAGPWRAIHHLWRADWGFDWAYDKLFVRPLLWFARIDKTDAIDAMYRGLGLGAKVLWHDLSLSQSGKVRWYAAAIAGGSVVFIAMVLLTWR